MTATPEAVPGSPSFIVFSDDWGGHPSSCQHLFRHIAREHDTLWVNTIGMRRPRLSLHDLRKAWQKVGRMVRGAARASPAAVKPARLDVLQPTMLPYSHLRPVRAYNRRSVVRTTQRLMAQRGMRRPVVVVTAPNAVDFVDGLDPSLVVYYCVDDFVNWPGTDSALVRAMEADLLGRADLVLFASEDLRRRHGELGKPSGLLPHGVDYEHFATLPQEEHPLLAAIPKPRVGYFGLFDERSDQTVIKAVATNLPNVSFVIIGPVATDTAALAGRPNLYFTGPVPYGELPAAIAGLDVLMLPYVVNEFTATLSPLKLREYLATSKPVIASPIAAVREFDTWVRPAGTPREWVGAIAEALQPSRVRAAPAELLRASSWSARADELLEACAAGLAPARPPPQGRVPVNVGR